MILDVINKWWIQRSLPCPMSADGGCMPMFVCSPHVWGPQIVRPEPRVFNLSPLAICSGSMELGMPSGHSTGLAKWKQG